LRGDQVVDSDPAAYWHWHESAFDAQSDSGGDWADEETFTGITEQTANVERSSVDDCRENRGDAVQESIDVDLETGRSAGSRERRASSLYNREADVAGKMVGAHPYENFANAIEQIRNA